MNFQNKNIVITGANGLVGIPTVKKCLAEGAKVVYAVDINIGQELRSLAEAHPDRLLIKPADLTYLHNCENLFLGTNVNIVLHLAGIKGSPTRAKNQPADYLFPMMMFNTNIIKASFDAKVDWFVYTSSVGVYAPADVMIEDSVWSTMPSVNDWHPGWAKRMGELAIDSLRIQHGWTKWTVIRPANIYGENDNFSPEATVIAANIWKINHLTSNRLSCWGDGSARRDFVFSDDVANAVINCVKGEINDTINFGCGEPVTIKETIETLVDLFHESTGRDVDIMWDISKPNGDSLRCLDSTQQRKYGILPTTSLRAGIKQTLATYLKNDKSK